MPKIPIEVARGCCGGVADDVPGVSGGTAALVLATGAGFGEPVRDDRTLGPLPQLGRHGALAGRR